MNKGQTSIEFLFVILITIVYIATVTTPLIKSAQTIVYDTENVSRANNEAQKITNVINEISTLGTGSRQTLNIFIPTDTNLSCIDDNISFSVTLKQSPWPTQCPEGICTKVFSQALSPDLNCTPTTFTGPLKTKILIEKSSNQVFLIEVG